MIIISKKLFIQFQKFIFLSIKHKKKPMFFKKLRKTKK